MDTHTQRDETLPPQLDVEDSLEKLLKINKRKDCDGLLWKSTKR